MTYGPYNPGPPGQYPPQGMPGQPPLYPDGYGPAAAPAAGTSTALLAPTGPKTQRRTFAGVVAAVAGLLLIVFSFFTWASASDSINEMGVSADMTVAVSGMGAVDTHLQINDAPAGFEDMMNQTEASDDETKMPGIWSVGFGVIVVAGAALFLLRRFPGIGALLTAVGGVAATITAVVFVTDPIGAVAKGVTSEDREIFAADYGLWLVLAGAVLALLAGAAMLALTLVQGEFDDEPPVTAPFGGPGYVPGQPQQFGGPASGQQYAPGPSPQFPGQSPQFPVQSPQFPGQPYPSQSHPGQPYPSQPFPEQQFPGQQPPGYPPAR